VLFKPFDFSIDEVDYLVKLDKSGGHIYFGYAIEFFESILYNFIQLSVPECIIS